MSIYGNIADQKSKTQNASPISEFGEFYSIIEATKIVQSPEKGVFVIVESEVAQVHDGNYSVGSRVYHLGKKDKKLTLFEDVIATYVAAFNGVQKGHKFSTDETENVAIWEKLSSDVFGSPVANPETHTWEYVSNQPLTGAVCHYKVIPDPKFKKDETGKKIAVRDDNGNQLVYPKIVVLGLVSPDNLSAEFKTKFAKKLHPSYI